MKAPVHRIDPAAPRHATVVHALKRNAETQGTPAPDAPYDFKEHIRRHEIELLTDALKRCRFNQKKTADFLGLTYHQLRGYLRKYELSDAEGDAEGTD